MRTLVKVILTILIACIVFIGFQAYRGVFSTLGEVFSIDIWSSMSAKDVIIFLVSLALSTSLLDCFFDSEL